MSKTCKIFKRFKVFFYGSLKKDEYNHSLISSNKYNKFLYRKLIKGYTLYMHPNNYPVAISSAGCYITGEIWEVTEKTYININLLEINAYYYPIFKDDFVFYIQPTNFVNGYKNIGMTYTCNKKVK